MRREVQTMRMLSHPNLVSINCCFVTKQELWLVMPFLSGGSALNLLKWEHQKGFDESTIATIIKSVLTALAYCHKNQLIHRDIKVRARWVTLRARWVTLRARWVTLRARW
jgi:serine/threonine-protein kinase OSR1/STK39